MTESVESFARDLEQALVACSVGESRGPFVDAVRVVEGRVLSDLVLKIQYHDIVSGNTYSDTLEQFDELLSSLGENDRTASLAGLLWSEYDEALNAIAASD